MDGTRSLLSQCHVTRSETLLSWKLLGQDCRALCYSLRACLCLRKYQLPFKNNFAIQSLRFVQLRIDFKVHPSFYPNSTVGRGLPFLGIQRQEREAGYSRLSTRSAEITMRGTLLPMNVKYTSTAPFAFLHGDNFTSTCLSAFPKRFRIATVVAVVFAIRTWLPPD